jgi:hypothetical protein
VGVTCACATTLRGATTLTAVVTYWQVYLIAAAGALAAYWAGWYSRGRYQARALELEPRGRHAARLEQPPAPLPELPAAAATMIDVRHANAMAATAPHEPSPLQRARARVSAAAGALAWLAAARNAWESSPWSDDTGALARFVDEGQAAEQERAA